MNLPPRAYLAISTAVALTFASSARADDAGAVDARSTQHECAGCHERAVPSATFARSAHKDLACTACHTRDASRPPPSGPNACVASFLKTDQTRCAKCHETQAKEHAGSVHNGERLPIDCATCHADIHAVEVKKLDKLAIDDTCLGCHSRQRSYVESVHYEALKKGQQAAPSCTDCHGLHAISKVDNDAKGRDFHTRACLKCHTDSELMSKSHVTPIAGETFFRSFHGKNVELGYPELVAGCADCHGSHDVHKADDPRSSVNAKNVVETCRQCHTSAGPSFAKYIPHAEDTDRAKYPALYWTRLGMTGLLVGTFLFFWVHSMLWAFRSFVERHRQRVAGAVERHGDAAHARKAYRRFETKHIVMHFVVIVSFLTLAVTGLPLKFSDVGWGKALMSALGGAHRAQMIHHTAAVVTFGYFVVALAMSARFLTSTRPAGTSVLKRLFGPESLFPNRRDLRDVAAMFRWFVGRGPKPTFDRWTYWEKFDFMAVFWGMFAIGLSGLMLWFPAFFSRFVPGWAFNIATIVHSDEALLATGFIFTVHFFNTHLRPEKFPMDTVIFDGRITHEEMVEERADQLRRYEEEGRTESLASTNPPSLAWAIAVRLFGFTAVAVGLSLAVVMVYALIRGH